MYRRGFTSLLFVYVCSLPLASWSCSSGSAASTVPAAGAAGTGSSILLAPEPPLPAEDGPLCAKYGGMASIRQVTQLLLDTIGADCRIRAFFAGLTGAGGERVRDCLSLQIGELFGCAGVSYAGAYAENGLECRGMRKSHIGLGITGADFAALIEDVASSLAAVGIEPADIEGAAAALLALRPQIVEVDSALPSRSQCASTDAGLEPRP